MENKKNKWKDDESEGSDGDEKEDEGGEEEESEGESDLDDILNE